MKSKYRGHMTGFGFRKFHGKLFFHKFCLPGIFFVMALIIASCSGGGDGSSGTSTPENLYPPAFNSIGEERALNSNIFAVEGSLVEFTVSAEDPDGNTLIYSAANLPDWADFDQSTGKFSGTAPLWSDDYETRKNQSGIFDVSFRVSDGVHTATKIVSIHITDLRWAQKTVTQIVEDRPVASGNEFKTPVELNNVVDETIWSDYGGGKNIRRITFGFTSQIPGIQGWEDDWVSGVNYAFLPLDNPAVSNAGVIIEGSYSQTFGETELAERICAELSIPALIIDRGWEWGHAGDLMEKYDDKAVEERSPEYFFYAFSSAHYLRASDALITIIDTMTDWPVSFDDFKVVFTGHSKLGHTCIVAAAAYPDRVAGFMTSGVGSLDTGGTRLLGKYQKALATKPDAQPNYRGSMMRYYLDNIYIQSQINPDTKAMFTLGTDDDKGVSEGYTPKYVLNVSEKGLILDYRIGCMANAPHTTQTPLQSSYWKMWVAHTFLQRGILNIDYLNHSTSEDGSIIVECSVSGASVNEIRVWATNQSDLDTSNWDGFVSYSMSLENGIYKGEIPSDSTSYFVEVIDTEGGIISSSPRPVNENYFMELIESVSGAG